MTERMNARIKKLIMEHIMCIEKSNLCTVINIKFVIVNEIIITSSTRIKAQICQKMVNADGSSFVIVI